MKNDVLKSSELWKSKLSSDELEVDEHNFNEFFRTMFERQEIWYKRFTNESKPWTNDKILRDNKFTNVYRELDRQSQYLLFNIMLPYDNKITKSSLITQTSNEIDLLFYYIMFFKIFNNNEFIDVLKQTSYKGIPSPDDYDPEFFENIMIISRENRVNPFTSSYLTNSAACPGKTRDWCFCNKVIPDIIRIYKQIKFCKTSEELIKLLETITSVSNFLSHEFYQDFTYITRYCKNYSFPYTQDDYTNLGPGCEVGIRLIFPNRKIKKDKKQGIYDLKDLSSDALKQFGDFKYLNWDKEKGEYFVTTEGELSLHQIEMWACEYQKYFKMLVGGGKQRVEYMSDKTKDYSFYLY